MQSSRPQDPDNFYLFFYVFANKSTKIPSNKLSCGYFNPHALAQKSSKFARSSVFVHKGFGISGPITSTEKPFHELTNFF